MKHLFLFLVSTIIIFGVSKGYALPFDDDQNDVESTQEIERALASVAETIDNAEVKDSDLASATEDEENQELQNKVSSSRDWRAPVYSDQAKALGWTEETFKIPEGLKPEVGFWIDIYSKYTTDQGVIHDIEDVTKIYEVLDFSPISARTDINIYKKEALKIKAVKDAKKRILGNKKIKASQIRFQLGQKDRVIQGIFASGRYLESFEETFVKHKVPKELTRMIFVESSFNVLARSKVGASGLWQLMPKTAKIYFKSNKYFDNRNHPYEATRAAAKFLRANYRLLKSWPLAITAYNHGPAGIQKIVKKYKTKEFEVLATQVSSRKSFGFASRNFYPSFLAVLEVEKNAPKYLGPVMWSQKLASVEIKADRVFAYEELLKWFDGDKLKAQVFNPHITSLGRKSKTLPKGSLIYVPTNNESMARADLSSPSKISLSEEKKPKVANQNRRSERN